MFWGNLCSLYVVYHIHTFHCRYLHVFDYKLTDPTNCVPLPGSSPSRIQGYPQDDGIGDKESKKKGRERGLIFLSLHRKPIKLLAQNLLCSWRLQAPSGWGEDAGCPLPGEDAGYLPDQLLEAQAKKWTQRALCPKESPWKKNRERKGGKRKKRMTRGDQASVSEAYNFIFKRNFYTLTCT